MKKDWKTLRVQLLAGTVHVHFQRPQARNALSLKMVSELELLLSKIKGDRNIRSLVLRGAGGNFCAGGDIKDMARARTMKHNSESSSMDPVAALNRRFGQLINQLNHQPQTVVIVVEGAAMGGGFGLVCVGDVVLADQSAKFRLPETSLGLPPAQIAPFLVQRIGLAKSRRLALTGARLSPKEAEDIGLVDYLYDNTESLEVGLAQILEQISNCAPVASATTKALLLSSASKDLNALLDEGAKAFSDAARSAEGTEGMMAFMQKRKPTWKS